MTVFIPEHKIEAFQKELNKLNKKLATYGSRVSALSKKHTFVERVYDSDIYYAGGEIDETRIVPKVVVKGLEVELSEPDILGKEGVEFLGTVTYKNNVPSIYSVKEDIFTLVNIDRVDACDHCNTIRERVRYFYFREDNTIKKIGSTCVKEWMGFDLESVFSAVQNFEYFIKEISEIKEYQSTSAPIENVISALAEVTNNFQSCWQKMVIKDKVESILRDKRHKYTYHVTDEQIEEIRVRWNIKPTNGFEFNIVSALMWEDQVTPYISFESLGVVCWAIHNALYKVADVVVEESGKFIGSIKERISFTGMMKKVHGYDGAYGYVNVYVIESEEGLLKWSTSNSQEYELANMYNMELDTVRKLLAKDGVKVNMVGTVKSHEVYDNVKQTVVTRCEHK